MTRAVTRLDQCESTNDEVRSLAEKGAAAGTTVVARVQTAGRGRGGRSWVSPPGALLASVVLRPRIEPARWGLIPIAAGLALAEALDAQGVPTRLRWPNDVDFEARKLAGILAESRVPDFAVVGLGVNVDVSPRLLPRDAATLAGRGVDADALLARTLDGLDTHLAALERGDATRVLGAYRARCATIGSNVRVAGRGLADALDVRDDGALLVRFTDGREDALVADDVHLAGRSEK
ncbi:MAG: biotin--[acetyl-CoA-carboxylase] ligase [Thermoplasmatota archaeon]